MANYRCPKHDKLFESYTDPRPPGSVGNKTLKDHPKDGHPDCPLCQEEMAAKPAAASVSKTSTGTGTFKVVARG